MRVLFIARSRAFAANRMPEFCSCIVEGRGRLLHEDPGLHRPGSPLLTPDQVTWWAGQV